MAQATFVQVTHNQINSLSATGLDVVLAAPASSGDALIAVVFGQKHASPFGVTNLSAATTAPVMNDDQNNTWASVKSITNVDLLTVAPSYPSTSESIPDLYAQFPSIYAFAALNVAASTKAVNVRATYLNQNAPAYSATTTYKVGEAVTSGGNIYISKVGGNLNHAVGNATYWEQVTPTAARTDARFAGGPGVPVFTGVDVVLLDFSGIATSNAVDGTAVAAASAANPANAGAITTTTDNALLLAIGLQKDANVFSAPAGWTVAYQGKLIGSEEHFVIMYKIQTIAPVVFNLTDSALTSDVATLTVADTTGLTNGDQVTFAGLTNIAALDGQTLAVTVVNGTTFTVPFTHADVPSAAETGTATYQPSAAGAVTPGFTNPIQYETVVVAAALKHS